MSEKIILDVDGAGDDLLAILYAAGHERCDLRAVTTVTGAAGHVDQVTKVALNTLVLAGRPDVPVYAGTWRAIGENASADREAAVNIEKRLESLLGDRIKGFNPPAPEPETLAAEQHAVDYIIEAVRAEPGEISIVATGPQTNVALALKLAPDITRKIKRIVTLGGCFATPGNMTPVAEYNIWSDPEAGRVVLRSGTAITLVPLDMCEDNAVATSMLTRDDLADLHAEAGGQRVVDHVVGTFPVYVDIWRNLFELVGFPLDDAIAVATVVEPGLFGYTEECFVDVALHGREVRGQTIAHRGVQIIPADGPPTTRILNQMDGRAFLSSFKNALRNLG